MGTPLSHQPLVGRYQHGQGPSPDSDDEAEWVVPVRWFESVPKEQAFWEKGMFANQNSACKLRQQFTLDRLAAHFDLDDNDHGGAGVGLRDYEPESGGL